MPMLARWIMPYAFKAGLALALVALLWFAVRHVDRSARQQQRAADAQAVERARSAQALDDLKHALATERRRAAITESSNDALLSDLATARAGAFAHIERMRHAAIARDGRRTDLPRPSKAASFTERSGDDAVLPEADLMICAENSVRLENARRWWLAQTAPSDEDEGSDR